MTTEHIHQRLASLNESTRDLECCVELLCTLQRSRGPVVETVLAIKAAKPNLHTMLKRRLINNPGLSLAMQL
ncbi:hypothetical protein [Paenibacillus methanolicus]|uniref:Uncharacterized protein n=1 Tax=Paenibacillus methanolicus TaxID=582686 RepID=A0A5S5CAC6_9BACL|nr:hypothetical protein [Paenibacillus methanolicus]TYP76355.1 hypothetical protein BCM02_10316 [Paenibacillus methanolicus]